MSALQRAINHEDLNAGADLALFSPSYVFATPVLGGQAAISVTALVGQTNASVNGIATAMLGPFTATRFINDSNAVTGVGDLFPQATLRWNQGVNNFMIYGMTGVPVGAYDPKRLANHRPDLQFYKSKYRLSERRRLASGLGCVTVRVQAGPHWPGRLRLPATHCRYRPVTNTWRIQVTRTRHWTANWMYLSCRQHAGISEFQRLQGIRGGKPAGRLEHVGHIRNFGSRSTCTAINAGPQMTADAAREARRM